ncbi:MAG: hypothetical protein QOI44_2556 [Actinomycetota bacterium]|nr:hypothetical protein [Actinomycetota bacterium]
MTRSDLSTTTYEWSMQWWDHDAHMVWNPPGSVDPGIEARKLHLVPNTAWLAYAQLATGDDAAGAEALAAIRVLIGLQYDRPGTVVHGTYRRFLEWPDPPAAPVMWEDYDPNWRQFVGTTLALILEDFSDRLDGELAASIDASIALACAGEPDGRIPPSYSNPALMRAWLDAWYGKRSGDEALVARGLAFAHAIVADFDRFRAFDEFNSPTYYGIDVYALRLWQQFAPDPYFATHGARLELAVWRSAGELYNANLRNFCGPFTRSYHPDATRSVTMLSLWIWALLGREYAPLPPLDAPVVDHGHDLMAGPVFDRLTRGSTVHDLSDFRSFGETRSVAQELAGGRHVSAWMGPELMLGAESSGIDWGGWSQFMPATAHWSSARGQAVLWMVDAHEVHAVASDHHLVIDVPAGASEFRFRLRSTEDPIVGEVAVTAAGMQVTFGADIATVTLSSIGTDAYEIGATPVSPGDIHLDIRFREV